uniref:TPX2 C-terminal domain-containing protein n=1 Tax=Brassica oleracea TaxID=3712 RepID=B2D2J5_BRAOL|nr:unknown protein [Brassica oleracea]
MDSELVVAADGADSAIAHGESTMEGDSSNRNGNTSEFLECCSTHHPMEASEGTQNEQVDDSKQMLGQKEQGRFKHAKTSVGMNIPSVLVKLKKSGKVVASDGSVAPNVKPVKSPKSKSLNGREAHVTKHGNHDSLRPEGTWDRPKRREFYSKLEETFHAKEVEKNTLQAKSKVVLCPLVLLCLYAQSSFFHLKETQEAELKMLWKSLSFKAMPMCYLLVKNCQLPKPELSKIAITRPKSPSFGRKKMNSPADSEGAITIQTPRFGRLSLDEKTPKRNPVVVGSVCGETEKPPVRKSLPIVPSESANLSNWKSSPVDDNADPEDSQEQAPRVNEDRNAPHIFYGMVGSEGHYQHLNSSPLGCVIITGSTTQSLFRQQ